MTLKPKISQFLPRVKPRVGDFLAFLLRFGKKASEKLKISGKNRIGGV
jgi:hypothetical protein